MSAAFQLPVWPRNVLGPGSWASSSKANFGLAVAGRPEPALGHPAGEGAGGLADVGLGIGASAQREQLEELAGEVLVRPFAMAGPAVEPDEHGRVGDHRVEQPGEAAERPFAERLDLRGQGGHAVDLRQAGGEVAVPEERQPLAERVAAEEHAIEPVSPQPSRVGRPEGPRAQAIPDRFFLLRRRREG